MHLEPYLAFRRAAIALAATCIAVSTNASDVALFYNSAYVDTTTEINVHGGAGEALNLKTSLEMHGQDVQTFTGIAYADFEAALENADILAIPELDIELTENLDEATIVLLAEYVCHGGGLIIMGSPFAEDFLREVFNFNSGGYEQPTVTFRNDDDERFPAVFETGPDTLNDPSITWGMVQRRLPPNGVPIYDNGRNATVVTFTFGNGNVLFFGYDWFGTRPEGWETVFGLGLLHAVDSAPLPVSGVVRVDTLSDEDDGGDPRSIPFLIATPGSNGISLREAMEAANNTPCTDIIAFDVMGTIVPLAELPTLTDQTGGTQISGADGITLDGSQLMNGESGITIVAANNRVVGLDIVSFPGHGIEIYDFLATGNEISGCNIGTDGTTLLGNGGAGVMLRNDTSLNVIGGTSTGTGNIIVANGEDGIRLDGTFTRFNTIQGNEIGTTEIASDAGNGGSGIRITGGSHENLIGVTTAGMGPNLIAENGAHGVVMEGSSTTHNQIRRNAIWGNTGEGIRLEGNAQEQIVPPFLKRPSHPQAVLSPTAR